MILLQHQARLRAGRNGRRIGDTVEATIREAAVSEAPHPQPAIYRDFTEFYPAYLAEHANRTSRRLHFVGSSLALVCLALVVMTLNPLWLVAALVCGYSFAWVGHFFFEHNRPATFRQPFYSLMGDWKMYWQTLTGRIPF
jgi:hypothetical protein